MIGVFAATNFFLFYVFWELTIVPVFPDWRVGKRTGSRVDRSPLHALTAS